MRIELICACPELSHTLEVDKEMYDYLKEIMVNKGQYKKVNYQGVDYAVPMGFIMVHGLDTRTLPIGGFSRWQEKN